MNYLKPFIVLFFIIFSAYIEPIHSNGSENHLIRSFEEDITGDGLHEKIDLNGELLSEESNYYRNIWLSITSPFANEWKIPLKSGYEPNIQFIDLNHDHINDIFFVSKHSELDDAFQYNLYSLANGKIEKIPLPKQQFIQGQYKPDFKIGLKLSPYSKETTIDISRYKNDYINSNIYDINGNLLKKISPSIKPLVHLEPALISESKGYGLKSVHYLMKENDQSNLGKIETLWYYKNNNWIILQSKWHKQD